MIQKLIEQLEKLTGKKVKLTEAPKPIVTKPLLTKVIYGTIAGGRAGNSYDAFVVSMDLTSFETFKTCYNKEAEDGQLVEPNGDDDYITIYKALRKKKAVAVFDSFGEGVVGFGFNPKDVKLAVLETYNGNGDGW